MTRCLFAAPLFLAACFAPEPSTDAGLAARIAALEDGQGTDTVGQDTTPGDDATAAALQALEARVASLEGELAQAQDALAAQDEVLATLEEEAGFRLTAAEARLEEAELRVSDAELRLDAAEADLALEPGIWFSVENEPQGGTSGDFSAIGSAGTLALALDTDAPVLAWCAVRDELDEFSEVRLVLRSADETWEEVADGSGYESTSYFPTMVDPTLIAMFQPPTSGDYTLACEGRDSDGWIEVRLMALQIP